MTAIVILPRAGYQIEETYEYMFDRWGEAQADRYFAGLADTFERIADRSVVWRPLPRMFGVEGYFRRYQRHTIYWRVQADDAVAIVAILHERMDDRARLRGFFDDEASG